MHSLMWWQPRWQGMRTGTGAPAAGLREGPLAGGAPPHCAEALPCSPTPEALLPAFLPCPRAGTPVTRLASIIAPVLPCWRRSQAGAKEESPSSPTASGLRPGMALKTVIQHLSMLPANRRAGTATAFWRLTATALSSAASTHLPPQSGRCTQQRGFPRQAPSTQPGCQAGQKQLLRLLCESREPNYQWTPFCCL